MGGWLVPCWVDGWLGGWILEWMGGWCHVGWICSWCQVAKLSR